MVWLGRPPPPLVGALRLLAAAALARDTGSLMGQATDSYRAWDEVLYAGSPPEGWEQDAAGRWWPPGERAGADRRLQANRGLGAFLCVGLIVLQLYLATESPVDLVGALVVFWWIGTGIGVGMVMDAKGHGPVWYLAGLAVPPLGVVAAIAMPARIRHGRPGVAPEQQTALPPQPPARRESRRRPDWTFGGLSIRQVALVVVGGFAVFGSFAMLVLAAAGNFSGDDDVVVAGISTTTAVAVVEQSTSMASTSTTATTEPSSTGLPTEQLESLPFGQMHERAVGFGGAGWDISIDETRPGEVSSFGVRDGYEGACTVVIGTAVLREWEGEGLTSNPFSFPSIKMVDQNARAESDTLRCEIDSLEAEGLVWRLDIEVIEGAEVRWFDTFLTAEPGAYQAVAVEQTIYTPTGS